MKKYFATIRQEKIRTAEIFNSRLAHNKRSYFASNVNKTQSIENITLVKTDYENIEDFAEKKRSQIREHNLKKGTKYRMIRKTRNKKTNLLEYKSLCQEFIFSHSHNALNRNQSIKYCKLAHEFIKNRFKDNEIISSVIHLDEKTPHVHIIISYFNEKECRFNQEILKKDKLTDINEIRNDFDKYIKPIFPTLKKQDGSVVKPSEWKQANKKIEELEKQIKALEAKKEILEGNCTDLEEKSISSPISVDLDDLIKDSEKNLNENIKITRTRKRQR